MPDDLAPPARRTNPVMTFVRNRWIPIVLALLAGFFIGQNRDRISIDLFWISVRTPLWLILITAVVIGILIGATGARRRQRRTARH